MIVVPGRDVESFNKVISESFAVHLRGRPWFPLVAKLCNAPSLIGLPMLQQLRGDMVNSALYNYEWLRENCATVNKDGSIADLYIAMVDDTLSWAQVRKAPRYIIGLEHCWSYDKHLDRNERQPDEAMTCEVATIENEAPAKEYLLPALSPVIRTKRPGPVMSRKSSFGSAEDEFAKRARLNCTESVDRLHQKMTEAA